MAEEDPIQVAVESRVNMTVTVDDELILTRERGAKAWRLTTRDEFGADVTPENLAGAAKRMRAMEAEYG